MPALLPLVCLGLTALWLARRRPAGDERFGRREAFLAAAVLLGVLATAIAELTSLVRLFDRNMVIGSWLLLTLLLVAGVARVKPSLAEGAPSPARPNLLEVSFLVGLAGLVAAAVLTAWAAAPNNWDSLTYHLPRVAHWIQDGTVAHYPTNVPRQLTLGPGAELLTAELVLTHGSDRLVNFVQTFAWLGGMVAASLLAKDLGAGRSGQVLAGIFAATLPMAILQASSTQNDLVVSFWLLAFVHFSLRSLRQEGGWTIWLLIGGSLGLALLTKATAYLFAFPFLALLAVGALGSRRAGNRTGLAAAGVLALIVNVGFWSRNLALFGSPLGGEHGAVNAAFSPAITLSSVVRNLALQLTTPSVTWNRRVEEAVRRLHLGLGVSPSDPRSTWKGAEFHVPARLRGAGPADSDEALYAIFHEDQAGNPLHLMLSLAAAALVFGRPAFRSRPALVGYGLALAGAFLLFSFVLKWQPWGARLQLPLFLLAAPMVGVALGGEARGRRSALIPALLLIASCPWALLNGTRPLLGPESVLTTSRLAQSFANRPQLALPLAETARFLADRGCRRIGLQIGPDDPEYLLWTCLRAAGAPPARVEHLAVKNRSAALADVPPFAGFSPCAVIEMLPQGAGPTAGELFARDWPGGRIAVRSGSP